MVLYIAFHWSSTPVHSQLVNNPPATWETWVGKIPWRRERLPTLVFWPRELNGLYSPWGREESDTTERLSLIKALLFSDTGFFLVVHVVHLVTMKVLLLC